MIIDGNAYFVQDTIEPYNGYVCIKGSTNHTKVQLISSCDQLNENSDGIYATNENSSGDSNWDIGTQ